MNHFSRILWKLEVSQSKFFLNLGTVFKEHLSTSSSISQPEALLQSTSEQHLEFVFITALLLIGILLEVYWIRERKNWISRQMDIESFSGPSPMPLFLIFFICFLGKSGNIKQLPCDRNMKTRNFHSYYRKFGLFVVNIKWYIRYEVKRTRRQ